MNRRDTHYVTARLTEVERADYDAKLAKTYYTGKLFLLKLLDGDDLREKAPKEVREVDHQLFRIQQNCFQLWAGNKSSPEIAQLYYKRYRYLEKVMADICDIVYSAHLCKND